MIFVDTNTNGAWVYGQRPTSCEGRLGQDGHSGRKVHPSGSLASIGVLVDVARYPSRFGFAALSYCDRQLARTAMYTAMDVRLLRSMAA